MPPESDVPLGGERAAAPRTPDGATVLAAAERSSGGGDPSSEARRGPLTGKLIQGRYLIKELVGEGGMGAVYRAEHTLMSKELAFKVLLPEFGTIAGLARRFQQEAQSASRLDHPGIIQVFDFGETDDGLLYLAMSFLRGRSLTEVIESEAPLPLGRAIPLAQQICAALAHAHEQGVVHRDLKPDNVMIVPGEDGAEAVKLLDFGIAKITQGEGAASGLTEAGMVFGTPEYLSPEQAAGDAVDARTDLYSLGVILYEMFSGRKLFEAETNVRYIYAHLHEAPRPMAEAAPEVPLPAALDQVVLRAVAKQPEGRYQSAVELSRALSDVLRSLSNPSLVLPPRVESGPVAAVAPATTVPPGVTVPPGATLPPHAATGRRSPLVWILGSVIGALSLLVVILALVLSDDTSDTKKRSTLEALAEGDDSRSSSTNLLTIEALLAASKLGKAEEQLTRAIQRSPKSARVHLLFGHLHCRRGKVDACLGSYQTSILLDSEMREDATLLRNVSRLIGKRKGPRWGRSTRVRAVAFVKSTFASSGKLGPKAAEMLTKYVNHWKEADLVWDVIAVLERQRGADGVDYVHAYELRFRQEPACKKRQQWLVEILARGDKKFLPLLGRIYAESSFKRMFAGGRIKNDCLHTQAGQAIRALGGELPARKPSGKSGGKGSSSVGSKLRSLVNKLR